AGPRERGRTRRSERALRPGRSEAPRLRSRPGRRRARLAHAGRDHAIPAVRPPARDRYPHPRNHSEPAPLMSITDPLRLGPLATTSTGSFPRPAWLAETHRTRATFRLEGPALAEAQDDATLVSLVEQRNSGSISSPTASSAAKAS